MEMDLIWAKHIASISNRCCEVMWFEQWENNISLLMIFLLPTNHDYGRWIQHLYDIEFLYIILNGLFMVFFIYCNPAHLS